MRLSGRSVTTEGLPTTRAVSSGKRPASGSCKLVHVDTRSLIALGMVLSVVVVALMRGQMDGPSVKDIVILLAGGIIGFTVPRARIHQQPRDPPDMPAGSSGPNRISAP